MSIFREYGGALFMFLTLYNTVKLRRRLVMHGIILLKTHTFQVVGFPKLVCPHYFLDL